VTEPRGQNPKVHLSFGGLAGRLSTSPGAITGSLLARRVICARRYALYSGRARDSEEKVLLIAVTVEEAATARDGQLRAFAGAKRERLDARRPLPRARQG
jgi:hypothetical protein